MDPTSLLDQITPSRRLALAYGPQRSHGHFLALFALDGRLAAIVDAAKEPLLAQLKLAWWRDQLAKAPADRPHGEPILALVNAIADMGPPLAGLVDGWEGTLAGEPQGEGALRAFADARAAACAAIARAVGGDPACAAQAGFGWALGDLGLRLGQPDDQAMLRQVAAQHDWHLPRLDRALRPLVVLHGLARQRWRSGAITDPAPQVLLSIRLGMLGF